MLQMGECGSGSRVTISGEPGILVNGAGIQDAEMRGWDEKFTGWEMGDEME